MASVFVQVEVEDATVDSLSRALQSERTTSDIERAVRQTLDVPVSKRVMVEPFRNGVVLDIATAQIVENALEAESYGDTEDARWARGALQYVRAALEVIQHHGG